MLLQVSVEEAIAATDALEDDAFGGVVEEACVVPGDFAGEVEDEAEAEVLDGGDKSQYCWH